MKGAIGWIAGFCMLIAMIGCAPGNRSTREKRSGIGDTAGGNTSGIPDTAGGQPATGVVIGRSLGLATGFLVGDQLQGQESLKPDQRLEIDGNQAEIQRQRRDMEKIRRQGEY